MNFTAHLGELRSRLLSSVLVILGACVASWFFSAQILNVLRRPIQPFLQLTKGSFIFTAPLDNILAHLQLSFFTGLFISSPYWLNQIWRFVAPGLYKQEKRLFFIFWLSGSFLFLLGLSFAYFVVFPLIFRVLIPFGGGVDHPMITIKNYLSFLTRFMLVFGLIFNLPLFLAGLCRGGLLSPDLLKQYRRHAIVVMALLSAFITPPDVFSQLLLLIPLIILYELSIYLAYFVTGRSE